MDIKTALSIAILFGVFVFMRVGFITVTEDGHSILEGLFAGGVIGTISGFMSLGVLSCFVKKEEKALIRYNELGIPAKSVQPKPEYLSDRELTERIKSEETLLNKYKSLLNDFKPLNQSQKSEQIKVKIKEKEIYLKELLIESMKRMVLISGKKIEDTVIPIMIRSIELMKAGFNAEDAQAQASAEFIQKRDSGDLASFLENRL